MSDQENKIDDIFRKIGDLDNLSDDTDFDSEILWQKVQTQLAPKPKLRLIWYWAAAMCLVLMASWLAFWQPQANDKSLIVTKNTVRPLTSSTTVLPKIKPQKQQFKKKEYGQDQADSPNLSTDNRAIENQSMPQTQPNVLANTLAETTAPKFEISPQLALEHIVISSPVVKKKMKIVHINELENTEIVMPKNAKQEKSGDPFFVLGSPNKLGSDQDNHNNIPILTSSGILKKQ